MGGTWLAGCSVGISTWKVLLLQPFSELSRQRRLNDFFLWPSCSFTAGLLHFRIPESSEWKPLDVLCSLDECRDLSIKWNRETRISTFNCTAPVRTCLAVVSFTGWERLADCSRFLLVHFSRKCHFWRRIRRGETVRVKDAARYTFLTGSTWLIWGKNWFDFDFHFDCSRDSVYWIDFGHHLLRTRTNGCHLSTCSG